MRSIVGAPRGDLRGEGVGLRRCADGEASSALIALLAAHGLAVSPTSAGLEGASLNLEIAHLKRFSILRLSSRETLTLHPCPTSDTLHLFCRLPETEAGEFGETLALDGTREAIGTVLPPGPSLMVLVIPLAVATAAALSRGLRAPRAWPSHVRFGRAGSTWVALLSYLLRLIDTEAEALAHSAAGAELEEALCLELLRNWGEATPNATGAVPRHVRLAIAHMEAHAARNPSIGEVARASGVSERVLSAAFRRFRGTTPSAYLRELRLNGVNKALKNATPRCTVAGLAANWGYANFGLFARAYAEHFGELPSATLRRARDTSA